MNITKMKIKEIKLAKYNPRKMDNFVFEKLKKSIEEFGYIEPIIVNKRNNVVIGGNQRLKALLETKKPDDEIDVVLVNLSEDKEKALNIALNKISGEWDYDMLTNILKEIKNNDAKILDFTGMEEKEIKSLLNNDILYEVYKEKEYDENIETKNKCPKCGYEW